MLSLNYRDARPLYRQIKDSLRHMILTGALAPDEKLPSVRSLATSLAINPNTIQRAYGELESEGFLYTVPGRGSFACPGDDAVALRRREVFAALEELVRELACLGLSREEVASYITEAGRGEPPAAEQEGGSV